MKESRGCVDQPCGGTRAQAAADRLAAGRRDTLLVCLLLDHGLRVGEIAILRVEHLNLQEGTLRFYRPRLTSSNACPDH